MDFSSDTLGLDPLRHPGCRPASPRRRSNFHSVTEIKAAAIAARRQSPDRLDTSSSANESGNCPGDKGKDSKTSQNLRDTKPGAHHVEGIRDGYQDEPIVIDNLEDRFNEAETATVPVAFSVEEDDSYLPSAVEFDPDSKQQHNVTSTRRKRFALPLACLVVFSAVFATIGVVISVLSSSRDSASRREELELVIEHLVGHNSTTSLPYKRALNWLIENDSKRASHSDNSLHQRFLLAFFYFDIISGQETPKNDSNYDMNELASDNWLAANSECQWSGIQCDRLGHVRSIVLENADGVPENAKFSDHAFRLPFLQSLSLKEKGLHGSINANSLATKHLRTIDLRRNFLTGTIPRSLSSLHRSLENLSLSRNQLGGTIAQDFSGQKGGLRVFDVAENKLNGTIPSWLLESKNLLNLRLAHNGITSSIPTAISYLVNLLHLDLGSNRLTSTIPSEIATCKRLKTLALRDNRLSGQIPLALGSIPELRSLKLESNRLTGWVPNLNMSSLFEIDLSHNRLDGHIDSLLAIPTLGDLKLQGNRFTGTVPLPMDESRLFGVDISLNQLSGSIPTQYCRPDAVLTSDCLSESEEKGPAIQCSCCAVCCRSSDQLCLEV